MAGHQRASWDINIKKFWRVPCLRGMTGRYDKSKTCKRKVVLENNSDFEKLISKKAFMLFSRTKWTKFFLSKRLFFLNAPLVPPSRKIEYTYFIKLLYDNTIVLRPA